MGFWKWDTVPFVDKAAVWAYRRGINPPTVETLYRLNMDVEINLEVAAASAGRARDVPPRTAFLSPYRNAGTGTARPVPMACVASRVAMVDAAPSYRSQRGGRPVSIASSQSPISLS